MRRHSRRMTVPLSRGHSPGAPEPCGGLYGVMHILSCPAFGVGVTYLLVQTHPPDSIRSIFGPGGGKVAGSNTLTELLEQSFSDRSHADGGSRCSMHLGEDRCDVFVDRVGADAQR